MPIKYRTLQLVRFITHLALETARRTLDIVNTKMLAFLPLHVMALFAMGRCALGMFIWRFTKTIRNKIWRRVLREFFLHVDDEDYCDVKILDNFSLNSERTQEISLFFENSLLENKLFGQLLLQG